MKKIILCFILIFANLFCALSEDIYFPPKSGSAWETISPQSLNWDTSKISTLYNFLEEKNSKAFLVLLNGKIVIEKYFGQFTADSMWYWASAGKTLTSALVGISAEEGLLSLNNKTSKYLGSSWSSLPIEKENLVTIRHQLTMTTGLDDKVEDPYCTEKNCLIYKSDAGDRWAYHNAPYTLLDSVLEIASGKKLNLLFAEKIRNKIGMNGLWVKSGYNNLYISSPRSMARFGILVMNNGIWDSDTIIPHEYCELMAQSSQNINKSYGFLWWLNGKDGFMLPQAQIKFQGYLFPDAPPDVFSALGKNGQYLNICPSKKIIMIRMGNAPSESQLEVANEFNNEIWIRLNEIINSPNNVETKIYKDIVVSPNPAVNSVRIQNISQFAINKQSIKIYDVIGNLILTKDIESACEEIDLNVEFLNAGLYCLKIGDACKKLSIIK